MGMEEGGNRRILRKGGSLLAVLLSLVPQKVLKTSVLAQVHRVEQRNAIMCIDEDIGMSYDCLE